MAYNQESRSNNEKTVPFNMITFEGLYDIRDIKDEDKNLILATFLRGLYYGDSWFSEIPKEVFMDNYQKVGEALLRSDNVIIKIACLKEEPDVILGYSILSADYQVIHWVYVKTRWRKRGIARSLTPRYPKAVTHLTKLGKELLTKLQGTVFNPFLMS